MSRLRVLASIVAALSLVPALAHAGQKSAGDQRKAVASDAAIERIAKDLAASRAAEMDGAKPTESPRAAKQVTAPGASSAGGSVVDAPSFVQVIGLAVDNELLGVKAGALTIDLSLFAFKALVDPPVLVTQKEYDKYAKLRRLGGSLTMGGKGEEFDQNGDGQKDKAKEAESLTDIIHAELRWRFAGTRDRRDYQSVVTYVATVKEVDDKLIALMPKLTRALKTAIDVYDKTATADKRIMSPCDAAVPTGDACLFEDRLPALAAFVKSNLEMDFADLGDVLNAYDKAHAAAIKAIDRQTVWTAVVSTTRQGAQFGPQRVGLGVRGLVSSGDWDHMRGVNYYCRLATTISAGEGSAKECWSRPDRTR